jgi:hypothetical protein
MSLAHRGIAFADYTKPLAIATDFKTGTISRKTGLAP